MYPFNNPGAMQKCILQNWGYNGGLTSGWFTFGQIRINLDPPRPDPNCPYILALFDRVGDGILRRLRLKDSRLPYEYVESSFHSFDRETFHCRPNNVEIPRTIPLK